MDTQMLRLSDESSVTGTSLESSATPARLPANGRKSATFATAQKNSAPRVQAAERDGWDTIEHIVANTVRSHTTDPEQGDGFLCSECGQTLCNLYALSRHRKTKHGLGRQWCCQKPDCKNRFKPYGRFDQFKCHMKKEHNIELPSKGEARDRYLLSSTEFQRDKNQRPHHVSSKINDPFLVQPKKAEPLVIAEEDIASASRDDLVQMLQAQMRECKQLREQCKVFALERDEYAEALRLSEEMRAQQDTKSRQALEILYSQFKLP